MSDPEYTDFVPKWMKGEPKDSPLWDGPIDDYSSTNEAIGNLDDYLKALWKFLAWLGSLQPVEFDAHQSGNEENDFTRPETYWLFEAWKAGRRSKQQPED